MVVTRTGKLKVFLEASLISLCMVETIVAFCTV